ncbi:hypothetical protein FB45DRAFT_935737 [Roridomyces roridus]|uniref:F-box domain-containing protein n=1 Tax=Roridomyces roridus TaxID=1738132 RepID=A0AAD7FCA8_9AGAR|nr:hypothetical protein FB45DRAFT_935737 [Roridomyces roridus]
MEALPPEIHLKLYSLACTDDGTTGCSLSAVSRRIRQLSSEHRYQSLAVCGPTQISRLLQTLRAIPPELRRIRFLFIHEAAPLAERVERERRFDHIHREGADDTYSHRLQPTSRLDLVDNPLINSKVTAMLTRSLDDPDIAGFAGVRRRNVDEILAMAHETLEILSVVHFYAISDGSSRYFNISFPALVHLTVKGQHEIPDDASFAPALRTLHVTDSQTTASPRNSRTS